MYISQVALLKAALLLKKRAVIQMTLLHVLKINSREMNRAMA
jgi:hypothetical protein